MKNKTPGLHSSQYGMQFVHKCTTIFIILKKKDHNQGLLEKMDLFLRIILVKFFGPCCTQQSPSSSLFMMDMLFVCVWHCVPLYHAQQGGITHQNHTKLNFHRGSDVALLLLSCSVDSTASERMSEKCPFCLFFSKGGFISFKSSLLLERLGQRMF